MAVLPQGAFDVQSIRATQTADPRAKQTRPSGPARGSGQGKFKALQRRLSRLDDGRALSLGRSGGEFSGPAPSGWPSSAR